MATVLLYTEFVTSMGTANYNMFLGVGINSIIFEISDKKQLLKILHHVALKLQKLLATNLQNCGFCSIIQKLSPGGVLFKRSKKKKKSEKDNPVNICQRQIQMQVSKLNKNNTIKQTLNVKRLSCQNLQTMVDNVARIEDIYSSPHHRLLK